METPETVQDGLVACEYCDLLQRIVTLPTGAKARCFRCGGVFYRNLPHALEHSLAFTLAGLFLYIVANVFPFLRVSLEGQVQTNTIAAGVVDLWNTGFPVLACLILLTTIVAPLLQLLGMLYVLLPVWLGRLVPGIGRAARFQDGIAPWAMLDVYMLALLVTLVKLGQMAQVNLKVGAFGAFFLLLVLATASYDKHAIWQRLESLQ